MKTYSEVVREEMKDWKTALLTVVFTVARLIYGYEWFKAGWEKATSGWLNFKGGHAAGLIGKMAHQMVPPQAHGWDPLHINQLWAWVAVHVFNGMPGFTDFLVPICEMAVGIFMILGLGLFLTCILALFLNVQFAAAGSANNFGYIWTNIIIMNLTKYAELLGLGGFLKAKKAQKAGK